MGVLTLFRTWAGKLCRLVGVPVPWPTRIISIELMLSDRKTWVRHIPTGPFAGGWQFPPELCQKGAAPPRPYQSPNVSVRYTDRRGCTQCALARIVAVRLVRYGYCYVPFLVRRQYIMDVAFSDRIGNMDGTGEGIDGITIDCNDHENPTEALLRWFVRARAMYALG